jgi:hypothetical protein
MPFKRLVQHVPSCRRTLRYAFVALAIAGLAFAAPAAPNASEALPSAADEPTRLGIAQAARIKVDGSAGIGLPNGQTWMALPEGSTTLPVTIIAGSISPGEAFDVAIEARGAVATPGATSFTRNPLPGSVFNLDVPFQIADGSAGEIVVAVTVSGDSGPPRSGGAVTIAVYRAHGEILVGAVGQAALTQLSFDRHEGGALDPADARYERELLVTTPVDMLPSSGLVDNRSNQAPGPEEVLVQGEAFWTDENGVQRPWRFGEIQIWDEDLGGDDLVTTVFTDDSGFFEATINNDDGFGQGGRDLFIRATTQGVGHRVDTDGGSLYRARTPTIDDVGDGTTQRFDFAIGNQDDIQNAFSVHQAMANAVPYVTAINGTALDEVRVVYPSTGSFFTPGSNRIDLLQLDRYDWDIIHHEYGHFVSDRLSLDSNPGGPHSPWENISERLGKGPGTALAYGEAWPTYFALSLQREEGLAALNVPRVGDDRYQDTEDISVDYSLETTTGAEPLGEDNEAAIARALWDAYDNQDDDGDSLSLGDQVIWTRLDALTSTRFSDAWDAVVGPLGAAQTAESGCIAGQWGMAPRPTAPADNIRLDPSDPPPTFRWSAGGGGPSFRNDAFVVRFWTSDFSSEVLATPPITTTSYSPSSSEWATITSRSGVRWTVEGTQTDAPQTGPYLGCNRAITFTGSVADVSTVLIVDASGSMRSNDPQQRRLDAGNAYLNVSLPDDEVGIVRFNSAPTILSEALSVETNRAQLRSAIAGIGSSGQTNIGRAVTAGCDVLTRAQGGQRAAILLTDGIGSYNDEAACLADQGWPVYVFGLSDAVDEPLLRSIAARTGGAYVQLDQITNLVCEFQQVRVLIAGGVRSSCQPTSVITPGQTIQLTESVTEALRQITFTNIWDGSDIEMTVTSPSGRVVNRSTVAPDVIVDFGPTFETFTIRDPEIGEWAIELFGADVPPEGETFTFSTVQLPVAGGPRPALDAGGPYSTTEGVDVVLAATASGGATSLTWDFDGDGVFGDATGPTPTFDLVGNDNIAPVAVRASIPGGGTIEATTTVTITNAKPTVAFSTKPGAEGEATRLTGIIGDAGWLDPLSATIDWGIGGGPQPLTGTIENDRPDATLTIDSQQIYGDNGVYRITVCGADDDATTCQTDEVTIANVAPIADVDRSRTTRFPGGEAFTVTVGDSLRVLASVNDPGSDDLTVTWDSGDSSTGGEVLTFLNDPPRLDPPQSPEINPRSIDAGTELSYDQACLYAAGLVVADDDGGIAGDSTVIIARDNAHTVLSAGFWSLLALPKSLYPDATIACYASAAALTSSVFGELRPLDTPDDARTILTWSPTLSPAEQLDRELLAAWLNYVNGAIDLTTPIDTDHDFVCDTTFGDAMATAEDLRTNPATTTEALKHQQWLMTRINHGWAQFCVP